MLSGTTPENCGGITRAAIQQALDLLPTLPPEPVPVMSVVNNFLLKINCSGVSESLVAEVNNRLSMELNPRHEQFAMVSQHAGGSKAMERDIYLMAANWVEKETVVAAVQKAHARYSKGSHLAIPNAVQLFWQPDFDPKDQGMVLIYPAENGA